MERLNQGVLAVSAFLLVAMAGMVALNVLSRYVLHVSLTWSAELARYCMVWSAMLAAAVLVNRRQHLAVELGERWLPRRMEIASQLLVGVLSMTFFSVMLVSGIVLVGRTAGQVASSIPALPMNLVYAVMPVSAFLMLIGAVATLTTDTDRRR